MWPDEWKFWPAVGYGQWPDDGAERPIDGYVRLSEIGNKPDLIDVLWQTPA
jgi:hypothetical protein